VNAGVEGPPSVRESNQELSLGHDLLAIHMNVEAKPDDVDVCGRIPVCARVRAVRIAERDVHAREFFVLQDVSDHFMQFHVGADGELADAVAVLVGVGVAPEILPQLQVLGGPRP
jgi:hypothetical protein